MSIWPTRTLLQARWQTFSRRSLVAKEFAALVRYLKESGCTFHSCSDLGTHPVPRGISFRYDVHVRDLPGAFLFADLHRRHRIPGTFFVFWDYSPFERAHLHDYLRLNKRIVPPLQVGLHDSPVDAFLLDRNFDGDRGAYRAWLSSAEAVAWFTHLSENTQDRDELNRSVLEQFTARVARTREIFGPVRAVAGHGGEIAQELRDRLPSLGPGAAVALSFFSRHWLTRGRVRAAGLDAAVDTYGEFVQGWNEFSCRGGAIASLAESIRRYVSLRNSAIQLLLHPYTWTGADRDAELSQALFVHGAPTPMVPGLLPGTANADSKDFRRDLQQRWTAPPTLQAAVSQLCTIGQFREPEYARLCGLLRETPRLHRKQWEFAYILRCVEKAGGLVKGRRGLGLMGERERLPCVFLAQGCTVVAALSPGQERSEERNALFFPEVLHTASFDELLVVQHDRVEAGSSDLDTFDFCWSSSMASHRGSLDAGLKFMERSLQWLKPGGIAVHTLEFNLESDVETVREGPVVLYREADLKQFAARMRANGHELTLNLHPGTEPDDLRIELDNPDFHLKLYIQDILSTSAGLCIRKAR